MSMVKFYTLVKVPELKSRRKLKVFICDLIAKEKRDLSVLTYIFCSDDYLLKMNLDFLKHHYYTDVITFDLGSEVNGINGEVYISVDRVRDNALLLGTKTVAELHRVMFHGALHLCGYKDKLKADKVLMTKKEDYYLKRYKV